jgi:AcrR family transcriptional regulator
VSKPTLYYYVKNKDEILLQCVSQGLEMTLEGIEASRRAGGNAVDQLRACMQVYARIVTMDFGMCLIRVGDEQVLPTAAANCAAEGRDRPRLPAWWPPACRKARPPATPR